MQELPLGAAIPRSRLAVDMSPSVFAGREQKLSGVSCGEPWACLKLFVSQDEQARMLYLAHLCFRTTPILCLLTSVSVSSVSADLMRCCKYGPACEYIMLTSVDPARTAPLLGPRLLISIRIVLPVFVLVHIHIVRRGPIRVVSSCGSTLRIALTRPPDRPTKLRERPSCGQGGFSINRKQEGSQTVFLDFSGFRLVESVLRHGGPLMLE